MKKKIPLFFVTDSTVIKKTSKDKEPASCRWSCFDDTRQIVSPAHNDEELDEQQRAWRAAAALLGGA